MRVVVENFQFLGAPTGAEAPAEGETAEGRPPQPAAARPASRGGAGRPPPADAGANEPPPEAPPEGGQFKVNDEIPF